MVKRLKIKSISILIIACLCMNFYMPVTHAQETSTDVANKLSMKLDLKGFSTYQGNNYVFEFGQDTGYTSARDIWVACITEGFSFKLDKALSTSSALGIALGITSSSSGSFTIGDKTYALKLNYKGGKDNADWIFEEVNPNINYYERFINTDSHGNVSTVLVNDINADYSHGTNFKQVFLKGMQEEDGASVKSQFISKTDNVDIYKLTAKIGDDTYEYNARITNNCNHSSVDSYVCNYETHVKDYIVDYLNEHNLDQSTYADYCVDMCSDCGKFMSVRRINNIDNPPGGSGENQEPGESGENDENNPPGGSGENQESGESGDDNKPSGTKENQETEESGKNGKEGEVREDGQNKSPIQSEESKPSSESSANATTTEKYNDGLVSNESNDTDTQTSTPTSKSCIKFLKESYKVKKGKSIKLKYKSSDIDYKKLKVKASKKGCICVKKITKSYILIKAKKKANLTITLKCKSQKAKVSIKIK